jgi:hypothetical protein
MARTSFQYRVSEAISLSSLVEAFNSLFAAELKFCVLHPLDTTEISFVADSGFGGGLTTSEFREPTGAICFRNADIEVSAWRGACFDSNKETKSRANMVSM